MKTVQRVLTASATSVLIAVGAAVLATPAHADVHVNPVGGLVDVGVNGVLDLSVAGERVIELPNPLSPLT